MTFHTDLPAMYCLLTVYLFLFSHHGVFSAEEAEHRDFQYNSVVDPQTGRYNFAYDTGHDNEIAHTLHMQYRDANGIVRGRYGYTDPRGKLRMVEYEAGPDGFVARGDVGPDEFPHDKAPETQVSQVGRYSQDEDLQLVPRPVQMAGWDPANDPMGQPVTPSGVNNLNSEQNLYGTNTDTGVDGYSTTNNTSGDEMETYVPVIESYDVRYPRISVSMDENNRRESEDLTSPTTGDENKAEMIKEEHPVAVPVNVNNIDVNPNNIRVSTDQGPVRRSADGDRSRYTSAAVPYSYRNLNYYRRQTHDHDAERGQATGYRVVYRPNHDHYNERYYRRQTHDHDAERRYVSNRQTHDHDAERRYVSNRQTHDHDAEKRYVSYRQTHDHDAERKYPSNRQTHDHDAERRNYYRNSYYRNSYYPNRRRIFYRDNHSMVPHEHYSDVYRNDNSRQHQHSDVQLYGRTQNLEYPATARPRQLKYIPSDKYHDKYYYWTDS